MAHSHFRLVVCVRQAGAFVLSGPVHRATGSPEAEAESSKEILHRLPHLGKD